MKTIYKYGLDITDSQRITMPRSAKVLSVQEQNNSITVWALVDQKEELIRKEFRIYGTGHPFDESASSVRSQDFIGTVQMSNGLVWHIFEMDRRPE